MSCLHTTNKHIVVRVCLFGLCVGSRVYNIVYYSINAEFGGIFFLSFYRSARVVFVAGGPAGSRLASNQFCAHRSRAQGAIQSSTPAHQQTAGTPKINQHKLLVISLCGLLCEHARPVNPMNVCLCSSLYRCALICGRYV